MLNNDGHAGSWLKGATAAKKRLTRGASPNAVKKFLPALSPAITCSVELTCDPCRRRRAGARPWRGVRAVPNGRTRGISMRAGNVGGDADFREVRWDHREASPCECRRRGRRIVRTF